MPKEECRSLYLMLLTFYRPNGSRDWRPQMRPRGEFYLILLAYMPKEECSFLPLALPYAFNFSPPSASYAYIMYLAKCRCISKLLSLSPVTIGRLLSLSPVGTSELLSLSPVTYTFGAEEAWPEAVDWNRFWNPFRNPFWNPLLNPCWNPFWNPYWNPLWPPPPPPPRWPYAIAATTIRCDVAASYTFGVDAGVIYSI